MSHALHLPAGAGSYDRQTGQSLKLDFKYHHEPVNKESLAPFIQKLKDKNQAEKQQKQVFDAIYIFYQPKPSVSNFWNGSVKNIFKVFWHFEFR